MEPVGVEEHGALERQEDVDHLMREAISMHSEAISMHSSDRRMSYRTTSEHHLGCLGRLRKRVEGGAHREGRSARKGARQGTHAV